MKVGALCIKKEGAHFDTPSLRFIICSFNECGKGIYVFLFGLSWIYLENESVRIKKMEFS